MNASTSRVQKRGTDRSFASTPPTNDPPAACTDGYGQCPHSGFEPTSVQAAGVACEPFQVPTFV